MQRVRGQIGVTEKVCGKITGKGVVVAVLDTGLGRHPDMTGRLWAFRDFVNGRQFMYDDSGHGTHVCGIICGDGKLSGGKYAGIAPGAGLVVGKVLDGAGDGSTEDMLKGLEWIDKVDRQYGIRVLNISIGIGDLKDAKKEARMREQLEALWDKGITVICAAGNKGPGNGTISAIGASRKLITVGCHDGVFCKYNPRRCETYSGRGRALSDVRKPDIVAPGTDIISCNCFMTRQNGMVRNGYISKSGTSMATPVIAGTAALFFEKYPQMTNEEFKQKLTFTALDLGEAWNKQGWGMVNVERLLD
ncbi:MAG: S8 family peptidase [Lachnospiraceae bacterium]|nr:S8 family peptidase [Lachnospiraceae bacterium]